MIWMQNNDKPEEAGAGEKKPPMKEVNINNIRLSGSERGPNTSGNWNNNSCCIGRYGGYPLLSKWGPI